MKEFAAAVSEASSLVHKVPQPATISVVIPAYNREEFLPIAIGSAANQTHPVSEIIVIDDGSTDGSIALLNEAAALDPRIKILEQAHGGANRARNAGIAIAKSEWIAFLDSDDAFEPEKIEKQLKSLRSRPKAIAAFTGLRHADPSGERIYIPKDSPSLFDLRCSNVLSSTSSAMVRTSVLREIGGFNPDLPSCQDWELWFRLRRAGEISVVQEPLVWLDTGDHDRITTNLDKVTQGHETVFQKLLEGVDDKAERKAITAMHKLVIADIWLRHGREADAIKVATSSIFRRPTPWAIRIIGTAIQKLCQIRSQPD